MSNSYFSFIPEAYKEVNRLSLIQKVKLIPVSWMLFDNLLYRHYKEKHIILFICNLKKCRVLILFLFIAPLQVHGTTYDCLFCCLFHQPSCGKL